MATTFDNAIGVRDPEASERRFFMKMALAMAMSIALGFSLHLMLGRSTFAVPLAYHAHAVVFFGWVALFSAQAATAATGQIVLHRKLGLVAWAWVPLMTVLGLWLMATVLRRTGAPFFFDQNQFLFSNPAHLLCFAGLTLAALAARRHTGWHRRLMIGGFAILTGPGLGRIIPLPLLMPWAWWVMVAVVLVWPAIGMIRDKRRRGAVHPAWYVAFAVLLAAQLIADLIAYSETGIAATEAFVAGTPGAARPMQAFWPEGM